MIIINTKTEVISVKIPNNYNIQKTGLNPKTLFLRNTTSKKEYTINFTDTSTSNQWYIFDHIFTSIPYGEYEYNVEDNKGILRITKGMNKETYDNQITFKYKD